MIAGKDKKQPRRQTTRKGSAQIVLSRSIWAAIAASLIRLFLPSRHQSFQSRTKDQGGS